MKKKCYLKKRLLRILYSEYDIGLTHQPKVALEIGGVVTQDALELLPKKILSYFEEETQKEVKI